MPLNPAPTVLISMLELWDQHPLRLVCHIWNLHLEELWDPMPQWPLMTHWKSSTQPKMPTPTTWICPESCFQLVHLQNLFWKEVPLLGLANLLLTWNKVRTCLSTSWIFGRFCCNSFFLVETSNNTVAKITHQGPTLHEDGSYKEEHVYDVTCLQEGETEVAFIIGNSRSETQE